MREQVLFSRSTAATLLDLEAEGRFSFEDGTQQEFTAFKYTARAPDDREIEMGQEVGENTDLYAKLQQQIREDLKGKFVKGVTITP